MNSKNHSSYREALRATSITGASSFVEVAVKMIKSKVIAVCVGPEGIGLFGILTAATGLITTLANCGLSTSGVRQVAAASSTNDQHKIAKVIYALRRASVLCGLLGMALILLLARPVSKLTTGSPDNARYLLILSPLVLFQSVSFGQLALLRGLRRIGDLAKVRIIGAVAATAFSVPFVWLWGIEGVAPAMLVAAASGFGASWWYARKVRIPEVRLDLGEVAVEAGALFGLGVAFLLTSLQKPILDNAFRAILAHKTDIQTVGQFLAASALSHVYVNFVLQAMGLDYLPRLTKHKDNKSELNRLVNEQTEIALLLAVPGVTALVVLAPLVIPIFYSARFADAIDVFRWQCLGVLLKVASWALGFVVVALGLRTLFIATETITNILYLAGFYVLVRTSGLTGAALAFAVAYLWYLPLIYFTVRRLTGFVWSTSAKKIMVIGLVAYAVAVCSAWFLPITWKWVVGLALTCLTGGWAYHGLCRRTGIPIFRRVLDRCVSMVAGLLRPGRAMPSR
ncbi:MAG: O-antigen translocase [Verrucomicrobiae bacterium]|nr:O-antigen translocase [Verrucomicrobiae bacterium]